MCFKQCLHIQIPEELKIKAIEDDKRLKQQKGQNNKSQILMTSRNDIIGSIAQNIVLSYFEQEEIDVESTLYFDETIHQDTCDFIYRGKNDVKGSPANARFNEVWPSTTFLLSDKQRDKRVDWYTFVRVDLDNNVAHIAGVISYDDFIKHSVRFDNPNLKSPCHTIEAKRLLSFKSYVFGI